MGSNRFRPNDRLLVFAPHPDDETLATGELIQLARAAGANVGVVFATDGDNNPWPQRWIEKRVRIGEEERARWGALRRREALAALAELGVERGAATFLAWPDQGLTGKLLHDDGAVDRLAALISAFAPTHVAMPSLRDRHPDHGALRVMLELAMVRAPGRYLRLGYVVHGREDDGESWTLPVDAARSAAKLRALEAHATQIDLSRNRLLRWAERPESFEVGDGDAVAPAALAGQTLRLPLPPVRQLWRQHELLLIFADARKPDRLRLRLPGLLRSGSQVLAEGLCGGRVGVVLDSGSIEIAIDAAATSTHGFVKLERSWPRLVVFDRTTWTPLEDLVALGAAPLASDRRIAQRASF